MSEKNSKLRDLVNVILSIGKTGHRVGFRKENDHMVVIMADKVGGRLKETKVPDEFYNEANVVLALKTLHNSFNQN